MSAFVMVAFPLFAVAMTMFALCYRKKDKNYLIPGFALLASALVNAVIGLSMG